MLSIIEHGNAIISSYIVSCFKMKYQRQISIV
nr:MAG TPA: hypothetical protein [Caudoviricetes sp.]